MFGFAFNDDDFSDRVLHLVFEKKARRKKYHKWFSCLNEPHTKDSESCVDVKVTTLRISSVILAAKSPFFHKLFKNGMRESQQRDAVTLKINESEEGAFLDVLKFMYHDTLTATSVPDLLDVFMTADKFEVTSCMRYCIDLLDKLPMSLESALSCLELPSCVSEAEVAQPLMNAAKQYLVTHFKDFTKSQEEAMELPLYAIEVVLRSDGLQVNSEVDVFYFILKWARAHYPKLEERQEIIAKHFAKFVCFEYMSCLELKAAKACPDFDHKEVSKLVLEALISKAEVPYGQHIHNSKNLAIPRRDYNYPLVKAVPLEFPWPRCVVYFNLKKDECANLFPSKTLYSQAFDLCGQRVFLFAQCSEQESHRFGLYVRKGNSSETWKVGFEIAVMKESLKVCFQTQRTTNECTLEDKGIGWGDLFGISWNDFMADDSMYFIKGILHIRVQLTVTSISKAS